MGIPFIDFKDQYTRTGPELMAAVGEVFSSQQFILKDRVALLEAEIARRSGAAHAVGVASGSDALYLALAGLGVGPGDEVIVPPFTFFATAGAVVRTGARPVFVDVDPKTFNLDPAQVRRRIGPATRAIVPVHLFGQVCDMGALSEVVRGRGIHMVEDAAQSFGADFRGRQSGSLGEAGCYSFFPTKNLGGAGDGGMIVTSDAVLASKLRLMRVHGSRKKYHHEIVGINSRLDELQAAIVSVKLKYIDEWNGSRVRLAGAYDQALSGIADLSVPYVAPGCGHTYHLYTITTPRRDELLAHLASKGIGAGVYYPLALHLQPCFKDLGYKEGDLPVSESLTRTVLSLPMFPELTATQQSEVIAQVRAFFGKTT